MDMLTKLEAYKRRNFIYFLSLLTYKAQEEYEGYALWRQ